MKTLFLLRHAKAENPAAGATDLSRALNERGKNEARAIGNYIKSQHLKFDLVLCSTAARARETAELLLAAAELPANVRYEHKIYEAGTTQLLEVVAELGEDFDVVLLVGHNPGMAELVRLLAGPAEQIAPGTLAKIDIEVEEWSKVLNEAGGAGSLDWIMTPGKLPSA